MFFKWILFWSFFIILKYYLNDTFSKELRKFISNRGGLEYYYLNRNLKIDNKKIQKIIVKEQDKIGELINIKENLESHMNIYKFTKESINVMNNNNPFINYIIKFILKI